MGVYEDLKDRGLIAQVTNEEAVRHLLNDEKITFYVGFDPTADSLHVGHFVPIMAMAHMQRAGHRPIALFGGGTAMIGDPSGQTDMRKMMTTETIDHNIECFKKQMSRLIDFSDGKAIIANNGDWLRNLNYIQFLREVGVHFSVSRMLAAECYKQRLERGLSFFEMNYMIMQSYDFLELNRRYGCQMQLGGDDQWSNMIGGVELCRRMDSKSVEAMTFTLLTTSEGKKNGQNRKRRPVAGPEQDVALRILHSYWRNVADADVMRCLRIVTFLPMDQIREMDTWQGSELNKAKEILAYEVTKLIHGEEEAEKAQAAARALFVNGGDSEHMPTTELSRTELGDGMALLDVLVKTGLAASRGEAKRLIQQGGVTVGTQKATDLQMQITPDMFEQDALILRKGKKVYHKVSLV